MASGRDLLGDKPADPLRVWLLNLEDPREELERRLAATMIHYSIAAEEIGGRLFYDSGRDMPVIIATETRDGVIVNEPLVANLKRAIGEHKIDVLIIDPFVASHSVSENDNTKIEIVVRQWAEIADEANCAIEIVHHTRKASAGQTEASAEDARGASALIAAVRSARVLNVLTTDDADELGIEEHDRKKHFRVDNAKANLAPPERAQWRKIASVDLWNQTPDYPSDQVAVVTPWSRPEALASLTPEKLLEVQKSIDGKNCRRNVQATDWVGYPIAKVLGLDPARKADKARINRAIKFWIATGALVVSEAPDAKSKKRPVVEVGQWVI